MKKILFLLLLPITCFAQSEISNFWEYGNGTRAISISSVIDDKVDSYMIYKDVKQDSDSFRFRYSPILYLKADGTYFSTTTSECGNDCFYYSDGIFKKIDETHIQLQIEKSGQSDLCPGGKKVNRKRRDLGIFEIKTDEDDSIVMKRQPSLIMRVGLGKVLRTITSSMKAACTPLYYVVAKLRLNSLRNG
uniref:hypothetical protein n=1 Tax=Snodgrassella alvi TaxID=1196083 RepID=UPI001C6462D4|nr:hypothetical protein [Snodgrassella alvi]